MLLLVFKALISLTTPWRLVEGACYKNTQCGSCVAENFKGGSCLWYTSPRLPGFGTCVAGIPGFREPQKETGQLALDSYGTWTAKTLSGLNSSFYVLDVDKLSDGSCYTSDCSYQGQCNPGYFAVQNKPCYSDTVHPDWRMLTCCREQRNIDGYLRGYEAVDGVIQGQLFFASCCATCMPGQVSVNCTSTDPTSSSCETCPSGKYNDLTLIDSVCKTCQPCPAGQYRVGCGPSTPGRCVSCSAEQYKLAGLEGSYRDKCKACSSCPEGYTRAGCSGGSAGSCVPCDGGSYFASPFCRNCGDCAGSAVNVGCGGLLPGVCTTCGQGRYQVGNRCFLCQPCTNSSNGTNLNFTGSWVRLGCGGYSPGTCVRMKTEMEVKASELCRTPAMPNALCQGASLSAKWSILGADAQSLATGEGNCTDGSPLCVSAYWMVTLLRRTQDEVDGVEVDSLGAWFAKDVVTADSLNTSIPSTVFAAPDLSLPNFELEEAASYFIRVSLSDLAGATAPAGLAAISADTADVSVASSKRASEATVEVVADDIINGRWQDALSAASPSCSVPSLKAEDLDWQVCETAKALQLGLPTGQRALLPSPLLYSAGSAELAALASSYPVAQARTVLSSWEYLYKGLKDELPSNISAWQSLVAPLVSGSVRSLLNSSNSPDGSSNSSASLAVGQSTTGVPPSTQSSEALSLGVSNPLSPLYSIAVQMGSSADSLRGMWNLEVESSLTPVKQRLNDLILLDRQLADSANAIGFSVVRMAQASTLKLRQSYLAYLSLPPGPDKDANLTHALHQVGSMAVMLLGSWGNSWRDSFDWRLAASVGNVSHYPPYGQNFGGADEQDDAIPLSKTRQRFWVPFQEEAEAWLAEIEVLTTTTQAPTTVATSTTTRASTSTSGALTTTPASDTTTGAALTTEAATTETTSSGDTNQSTSAQAGRLLQVSKLDNAVLAQIVRRIMTLVVELTEKVLEPLARSGSELLQGPLPSITACGAAGMCLTNAIALLSKDIAVKDAWDGLGVRVLRLWVDPRLEEIRIRNAATEIVNLAWSKARMLEELLLQVVDVREIHREPFLAESARVSSTAAANHLKSLTLPGAALGADGAAATWRWWDIWNSLNGASKTCRASAGRLARRRLSRLERLAAWTSGLQDDGYVTGPGMWYWRIPWTPWTTVGVTSDDAFEFGKATGAAHTQLLISIQDRDFLGSQSVQAYLHIEADDASMPLAFGGLSQFGTALFRLKAPKSFKTLLMHSEAQAFLVSPKLDDGGKRGAEALEASSISSGFPPSSYSSTPHIEVRLQRLMGDSGPVGGMPEPPQPTGMVPFMTRFERDSCLPMPLPTGEDHQEIERAALLPLDGVWMLTARDGVTGNLLTIDEGTSIRLLLKVDVPTATPPWTIIEDNPDVLYRMSSDGSCAGLSPIIGVAPSTSTLGLTTRTSTLTITTRYQPNQGASSDPQSANGQGGESLTTTFEAGPAEFLSQNSASLPVTSEKTEPPSTWMIVLIFCLVLGLCIGSVGVWSYVRRRRLKLHGASKIAPLNDDVAVSDPQDEHGNSPSKLKQRVLSEKRNPWAEAGLRAAAIGRHVAASLKSKRKAPDEVKNPLESARDWGTTDTPRPDPDGIDDWSEASTPDDSEASTPRSDGSSVSGSASESRSSASSSSSGRPPESPRTALVAAAAAKAAAEAVFPGGVPDKEALVPVGSSRSNSGSPGDWQSNSQDVKLAVLGATPRLGAELASTHISESDSLAEESRQDGSVAHEVSHNLSSLSRGTQLQQLQSTGIAAEKEPPSAPSGLDSPSSVSSFSRVAKGLPPVPTRTKSSEMVASIQPVGIVSHLPMLPATLLAAPSEDVTAPPDTQIKEPAVMQHPASPDEFDTEHSETADDDSQTK